MTNQDAWQMIITKQTGNPNNKFLKWENDCEYGGVWIWWTDENGDYQNELCSWQKLFFILIQLM